ncbi:hypothetical protein [Brevibacillus migulae]|nr:hypothetical protein [Brevibacillus migulae]
MIQTITVTYNPITRELAIKENEFRTFEAIAVLEAAKAMITNNWLKEED